MSGIFGFLNPAATPDAGPFRLSPASGSDPSGCLIAADARLDYRRDLALALSIDPVTASDADLILASYLRWGESCLDRFRGDFAFAIWDARSRSLFCARDHFGMRPFYYHHAPGARFVFASDARRLFSVPEVRYAVDEGRVADFLVPELEWIDHSSTFYEGVLRLPPGHKLTLGPAELRLAEYWTPDPGPPPRLAADEDWIQALLEVLSRAIDERLREPSGRVGCMLSGGVDSGAVAALAQGLLEKTGAGPLKTLSAAQDPGVACEETRRVLATVRRLGTAATIIHPDTIADLDAELLASLEEPFDGEHLFMKAIYLKARDAGLDALLDGGGGDIVLGEGLYLTRLLRQGRLLTALREVRAESAFWGDGPSHRFLASYVMKAVTPETVKRMSRRRRQQAATRRFVARSLINRDYARQVGIEERGERMQSLFAFDWTTNPADERIRKIRPNVSAGRERYARLARFAGVEARDPFLDLNVVRLCAHVPGRLLLRDGWPKFILREAMEGRLPDEVRWGRLKPHVSAFFKDRFLHRERARGRLSLAYLQHSLAGRADEQALVRAWETFLRGDSPDLVNRAYVLSRWLDNAAQRPVVPNQRFI